MKEITQDVRKSNIATNPFSNKNVQKPFFQAKPMAHSLENDREPAVRGTCPSGFTLIEDATWFHCDEPGARNLACSVCDSGRRNPDCHNLTATLGHSNIIAPPRIGNCGDIFKLTTPGRRAEDALDVTLAERPGGTPLDIHRDVIPQLGLDVDTGRYTVCLQHTEANDARVTRSGPAKCQ